MDTVGQRIKKIRKLRKMTQKEVAARAGLHEVAYQYYELGSRNAKKETLQKIADALEVDISFLQPTKLDTPNAILALIFDLVDEYGSVKMAEKGGTVTFGLGDQSYHIENEKLRAALNVYQQLSTEEFFQWLINYPTILQYRKEEDSSV